MSGQKIFLSAVSSQFKDCREALRSDLAAVGAEVVVQEDFTQQGGSLLEKLQDYIAGCDRVIALVGSAYGWAPEAAALPPEAPARSYTQWEYHFALGERLDGSRVQAKPLYVYFASDGYLTGFPAKQSELETRRQQTFIEQILASDKDRSRFDSIDQLARLVLRDGFRLGGMRLIQNLPYDSLGELFKGRDELLDQIRDSLKLSGQGATAIVAKQAIHGLGGIGKTRLAIEYAWRHLADYSACLFVGANSPENLDRNLAGLCELLDLPEKAAKEQAQQLAAVRDWLGLQTGWLLILDNVDTQLAQAAVEGLLPALQTGHVLITSRRKEWDDSIGSLGLDSLELNDAAAYLLQKTKAKRISREDDAETAHLLAQTLGGLALALEQAGSFINQRHIGFTEYLQRWAHQESRLRDFPVKHYPRTLAVTWETSFAQLPPAAQALLNLLCWFAPDPFPREPFLGGFTPETLDPLLPEPTDTATAPPDAEELFTELESLSLLKWETGYQAFSLHRLVQEIARSRLDTPMQKPALQAALELVNRALPAEPPPNDVRSWPIWDPIRPHLEQLLPWADQATITDPTSRLLNELGTYLYAKGLFNEAEPLMRRALAIDEASFGSDHPKVAIRLNNLAALLWGTNRLAEAEPLMRRALAIDEASFGSDHPDVAIQLNNLAQLLKATNRLAEAEPLMRRALAIDETSFGNDHPNVAIYLINLANLLQTTNRLAEAEPLMRRGLQILLLFQMQTGHQHPQVEVAFGNYLALLTAMGKTDIDPEAIRQSLLEELQPRDAG